MAPLPSENGSTLSKLTSYLLSSVLLSRSPESLSRRDGTTNTPGSGTIPPNLIPNPAIFVLFGLIGAGFIITAIWFFFWAKNGGFHFKEGDWEEYKSTVLRRKGPNGTTLSGATRTTDLGGGSVVGKRYRDFDSSVGTESEMSEIKAGRGGRKAKGAKPKRLDKKGGRKPVKNEQRARKENDVEMGYGADRQEPKAAIRAYRHEKPARVGGLNREADSTAFDGSTHDSHSDLLSNRQTTPTTTPTKKVRKDNYNSPSGTPGIRKVTGSGKDGFWGSSSENTFKRPDRSEDHIRTEARKLQEKGRQASAGRRDFSYTAGDDSSRQSRSARVPGSYSESDAGSRMPGSYAESDAGSDVTGTKTYHHPIPGLSEYAEDRRRARATAGAGGYRRGRRDEFSDSEMN